MFWSQLRLTRNRHHRSHSFEEIHHRLFLLALVDACSVLSLHKVGVYKDLAVCNYACKKEVNLHEYTSMECVERMIILPSGLPSGVSSIYTER